MYSFSQLQVYIQCPLKYRYKYVEKIPAKEFVESAASLLGGIVHSTLEKLYKDINVFNTPTQEALLAFYYDLRTTKEAEVKENQGEMIIHGDFTLEDYKRRGELYITKYYDKHQPFEDIKVIDTELDFVFDLTDDIKFKMIVDRLDKIGDTFTISDYKTNQKLPTQDKDNYIEQLTLYGI
jgi:ATP-dependent helicase/DNAse subunit B